MRRTKIICTLGPITSINQAIHKLIGRGMNVARLNLSHGEREWHRDLIRRLKKINQSLAKDNELPTCISILYDTEGPEIRTGDVDAHITIHRDETVIFTSKPLKDDSHTIITVNYPHLGKDAKNAEKILLDNGKISFEVKSVRKDGSVLARARDDGRVGSRRHVNLPGAELTMPTLTEKDWLDIEMGAEEEVDFFALSFVREARDIEKVRSFLRKKRKDIAIISKIETRQALTNIRDIITVSDGIMVARGDLGAEVNFETIPAIQDELVSKCREAGKPVIVATHMLESMTQLPMPTRAEVTDIAHAVMTGTDATMLSEETAAGKYPFISLEAMARIAQATEEHLDTFQRRLSMSVVTKRAAQADAAVELAVTTNAKALVVMSRSGITAREIARYRPAMPLIACTPETFVQRTLQLSYGVVPITIHFSQDPEQTVHDALAVIRSLKLLKKGDSFVLVSDARAHEQSVSTIQVRQVP